MHDEQYENIATRDIQQACDAKKTLNPKPLASGRVSSWADADSKTSAKVLQRSASCRLGHNNAFLFLFCCESQKIDRTAQRDTAAPKTSANDRQQPLDIVSRRKWCVQLSRKTTGLVKTTAVRVLTNGQAIHKAGGQAADYGRRRPTSVTR